MPNDIQEYTGRLFNHRMSYIIGSRPKIYLSYFDFVMNDGEIITVERRRNSKSILGEEYENITFRGYLTTNKLGDPMIAMVE